MRLKKYTGSIFKILIIAGSFLLCFLRNAMAYRTSPATYWSLCFGGPPLTTGLDLTAVFFWFASYFLMLYGFGDYLRKDFEICYVYVFTRQGKTGTWLLRKALGLLLRLLVLFVFLFALAFLVGTVSGIPLPKTGFSAVYAVLSMLLLNVVTLFLLSYVQNFLSLRYGSAMSFVPILAFYMFSQLLGLVSYNKSPIWNFVLMLLLPNNQCYSWHAGCSADAFYKTISGFRLSYSYSILFVYAGCILAFSFLMFLRCDLTELVKEE